MTGRKIMDEVPIPEKYFPGGLEAKVAGFFDEKAIPYARNVEFDLRRTTIIPDFVVIEDFKPRLIVETKTAYPKTDISERLEGLAFRIGELKKEKENAKALLVLGGMNKEKWKETDVTSFLEADYFDSIIHEEDLDRIEEEFNLEELLNMERNREDWFSLPGGEKGIGLKLIEDKGERSYRAP